MVGKVTSKIEKTSRLPAIDFCVTALEKQPVIQKHTIYNAVSSFCFEELFTS